MTEQELKQLVESIDSKNAEYIMNDFDICESVRFINRWRTGDEYDKAAAKRMEQTLRNQISEYDKLHLTPANVEIGQGATVVLWSDQEAGTIIGKTKNSITIQRDKATLKESFKPEWIEGGFAGHCINNQDQDYTYERDENGSKFTIYWSKKYNQYGRYGNPIARKGRHEFYDYNF